MTRRKQCYHNVIRGRSNYADIHELVFFAEIILPTIQVYHHHYHPHHDQVLPGTALQHQQEHSGGTDAAPHRKGLDEQ